VVSHGDADHSAGLASLLGSLPVGRLLTGPDVEADAVERCRAGMAWQWRASVRFQVLAPAAGEHLGGNEGSCVLRAAIGDFSLLLPGDIDSDRERELVRYWREMLRSDLALAPHHGSASSSSWAWLKAVQPDAVVYTHGRANRFGHPAGMVRQRHRQLAIRAHSTAYDGAIEWIVTPPGQLEMIAHRQRWPRFWER
jgi:competence protein ComEC